MRQKLRKLFYKIRYTYPTRDVITVLVVLVLFFGFMWGSVNAMQKNYQLRRNLENKRRQLELVKLQEKMLEYQQRYLKSDEYQELSAREDLGKVKPGEKVLIMPENSATAKQEDARSGSLLVDNKNSKQSSNFSQWMKFLFGGSANDIK